MKNFKKLLFVLVLLLVPFILTGCGADNSKPEAVSEAMLKMLMKDDYSGAKDIFYHEDSYFTDEAFAEIIKEKGLSLNTNKTHKLLSVGEEITDKNGNATVLVTYALDNNKTFSFNTIKVDNKWYVYDESFYNGDILISVPKGSTVKFDGTKLKDSTTDKSDVTIKHAKMSYGSTIKDVDLDVYKVSNVLKGTYPISVTNGGNEVKDEIGTLSKYKTSAEGNYTYKSDYKDGKYSINYTFVVPTKDSKTINSFVSEYYKNVYDAANAKKEFSEVSKYFSSDSSIMKSTYNILMGYVSNGHYTNYNVSFKTDKVYDFGNYAAVTGDLTLKYNYKGYFSDTVTPKSETKNTVLILEKDGNSYKVSNGQNYLPYY